MNPFLGARNMAKKRDTVTFGLKQGRKVVHKGTTNDPARREQEHRDSSQKPKI
jgi:hypothetical protein